METLIQKIEKLHKEGKLKIDAPSVDPTLLTTNPLLYTFLTLVGGEIL